MDNNDSSKGLLATHQEVDSAYATNINKELDSSADIAINDNLTMKWGDLSQQFKENDLMKSDIKKNNSKAGDFLLNDGFMSLDEATEIFDNFNKTGDLNVDDLTVHFSVRYALNDNLQFNKISPSQKQSLINNDNVSMFGTNWNSLSFIKSIFMVHLVIKSGLVKMVIEN
ncbi:hypothetical protein EW093_15635 [Thiospirochaeta perfilievii]|uniref:Uncharacterized protein n=1 Tax=Thiospirochaeta perfilievii TaxID=252967 RepID=A0A5C1QF56_9SPIO|nr:hypothetical protein [Thiospirochaeta perfilievii]QEN06057.1 hypothetical protein EW093_15635 [Thiospirochaeta perfilievii]